MPGGGIWGLSINRGARSGARLIHRPQSSLPNTSVPRNPCTPAVARQHAGCRHCQLWSRCPMLVLHHEASQGSYGPKLAQTTSSKPLCFPSPELLPNIIPARLQMLTSNSHWDECLQSLKAYQNWSLCLCWWKAVVFNLSDAFASWLPNPARDGTQRPGVSPGEGQAIHQVFSTSCNTGWRFLSCEDDSSGTDRGLKCDAHQFLLPLFQQDSEECEERGHLNPREPSR